MVKFILEGALKKAYEKIEGNFNENNMIIKEYLLQESIKNMYQLSKITRKYNNITFNIMDVVFIVEPENFQVGQLNFPLNHVELNSESYDEVKEKIRLNEDKEIIFYRNLYKAFKLVADKKDIYYFSSDEYRKFSTSLKEACEKFDLV